LPKPHLVSQRGECKLQCAPEACRSPASLHGTTSQKRKGEGDISWGNPSAVTALAAAVHISVGLNYAWFGDLTLNLVNIRSCYLLSQPPQHHFCSRKRPTAAGLSPLLSPSPLSLQHLPQFRLSRLHMAATQIQSILSTMCKQFLGACSSPFLGQTCLCSGLARAPPAQHLPGHQDQHFANIPCLC